MTKPDTPEIKQKKNITNILMGVGIGLLTYISGSLAYYQYQDYLEQAPATNWVEVTSLVVPNFKPGVNPTIDYTRNIKQSISSSWTAELRHYDEGDNFSIACERTGFSELEPGRAAPPSGWTLGSFAGDECVTGLQPGRYRLYITWELRPRGYDRTIPYPLTSNTFFVGDASGLPE